MPAEMTNLIDETLERMERYERFRAMADEPAERYEHCDVLGEGANESITPRDDDPVGAAFMACWCALGVIVIFALIWWLI